MTELPFAIQKAVDRFLPIEIDGLTFYPITVDNYEAFMTARPGLEVMQQALPMALVSLPLLSALHKLDFDAITNGEQPCGLFSRVLLFLALSLRLGEGRTDAERVKLFRLIVDPRDPSKLKSVRFVLNGEELHDITPVQFARYRPILAAQNGVKLEADDANPELVEAERDIQAQNAPKLEFRLDSLISTIALLSGVDEKEIYDWPLLKMDRRRDAAKRLTDYIVCGINEGAGCKWKGGNPVPSLWFDRTKETSSGMIPISEFANGAGARAVSNPGEKIT